MATTWEGKKYLKPVALESLLRLNLSLSMSITLCLFFTLSTPAHRGTRWRLFGRLMWLPPVTQ